MNVLTALNGLIEAYHCPSEVRMGAIAITELHKTVERFDFHWLPESGYRGVDGYDLEIYGPDFVVLDSNARMEYWVPVESG